MSHKYYIYVYPEDLEENEQEIEVFLHHLVGYCPQRLKYYREMADRMREDFPEINPDYVGCHHITCSDRFKGFTLTTLKIKLPKARIGLPTPDQYAQLVETKESYQKFPNLPNYGKYGWRIMLNPCDYNY